ncbi:hypothetical protein ACFQV2_34680 [Actinokineospora soli]|uniref:LPXTG-motif cell wall anchor domain-containing protein n=1 Tax=Actinokineospora soli TaxID=1048753 RepID=A0ABW2TV87_9PSEU
MSGVSAALAQAATVSEGGVLVGILAVAVGGGGVLLGLLRRRKTAVKKPVALPAPRVPAIADDRARS